MGWRSWTLTKIAVFGMCAGAALALVAAMIFYFYSRPKSWDVRAMTVQWSNVAYLKTDKDKISGFVFEYGISNNTDQDYELRKDGVTIMMNPSDQKNTLIPASFNYAIGRETFFLPAHQTSLIELHYDGGCGSDWMVERTVQELATAIKADYPMYRDLSDQDLVDRVKTRRPEVWEKYRFRKPDGWDKAEALLNGKVGEASEHGEEARKCFEENTKDVIGFVLFDHAKRYRLDVPKPKRSKPW